MMFLRIVLLFGILFLLQACFKEDDSSIEVILKLDSYEEKIAFKSENIEFPFYFLQSNYPDFFNFENYKFDESKVEFDNVYFATSYFDFFKSIIHFKSIKKNDLELIAELKNQYDLDYDKELEKKQFSMLTTITGFSKDQQFLIIDVNGNKNLNDDSIYRRDKDYFKNKTNENPTLRYKQSFYQNNTLENHNRLIEIKPYLSNYFYHQMKDSIAKKAALIGELKDYWKGKFQVGENRYDIAAQGFNSKKFEFLIKSKGSKFSSNSEFNNTDFRYKMYDTIVLNSIAFRIDTILINEDSALKFKLEKVDNYKAKDIGFRTNENIGNIELLSLDEGLIKLDKLSKNRKYTLIYFWGTWCAPCRESSKSLIELQSNYSDSLQVLGVAYEKNIEILMDYKEKTPWRNFFVERKYKPNSIIEKLHIDGFPSFILVNDEGTILQRGSEIGTIDRIRKIISKK